MNHNRVIFRGGAAGRKAGCLDVANKGPRGVSTTGPARPPSLVGVDPTARSHRSYLFGASFSRTCPLPAPVGMPYDDDPAGRLALEVRETPQDWQSFASGFHELEVNVEQVVRGKHQEIRLALVALLAEGHLLIEDVPGV